MPKMSAIRIRLAKAGRLSAGGGAGEGEERAVGIESS